MSIEPLLNKIDTRYLQNVKHLDWVIIGAESGNRKGKVIPKREWIENIVEQCQSLNVPVFMKNSLIPIMGEDNILREFPKQLIHDEKKISVKMDKRFYDDCSICKSHHPMKEMTALLYREKRGETAKQLAYVCKTNCFDKAKSLLGIKENTNDEN